jgi:hypothetical protein
MNFKSILSLIGLSTIASAASRLYTPNGDKVPDELLYLFNYTFDNTYVDMLINGYQRTCHYKYVDNCGEEEGEVDESKLSAMKENFDMKDYTQEELCKIIADSCEMISLENNPLTGQNRLYTKSGDEVPYELYRFFNYDFSNADNEMYISGLQRTCHYTYVDNCGEEEGKVDESKLSVMKENFDMDGFTQEELCKIISETCDMISFEENPLTGQKKLITKSGEEVPRELYRFFDYNLYDEDSEMYISGLQRTCYYTHVDNCGEEKGKVDESKLKEMKENFDMGGFTQEEFCKIIDETCEMISFEENPLTGQKKKVTDDKKEENNKQNDDKNEETNEKKLLTKSGDEVPKELLYLFNYSFSEPDNEMLISGFQRTCYYKHRDSCGEKEGEVDESKLSVMKENFDMKDYTQEELCKIIDETCDMIDLEYNPLTGQKRLHTKSGEEVPRELYRFFKYTLNDEDSEMYISGLQRTCYYTRVDNCGEEEGKIDESKLSVMKENFDMDGFTQEEFCKIIDETCEMISFEENPLTGEKKETTIDEPVVEPIDEPVSDAEDVEPITDVEVNDDSESSDDEPSVVVKPTKKITKTKT